MARYTAGMADKLKDFFDVALIRSLAEDLHRAHPAFDRKGFLAAATAGLAKLELTARGAHVAEVLRKFLPGDFEKAADVLVRALGPELTQTEEFGFAPFRYLPFAVFIGRYGIDHFETSLRAQYELTKRFTAEWSIRPFLEKYPGATCARLATWASDPSVHVRRLVSEGTRPRLPWAPRLRAFQLDPAPVLALLERLKDDPERYVQRSVANNLNDIGKDHPALAVAVCERWSKNAPEGRRWIVRHALRSLVKQGNRAALETLGFAGAPKIEVAAAKLEPRRVKLGATMTFSFDLVSKARQEQELLVDFAVHFVKANGSRRPKVFKLRALRLAARERTRLAGKVSFAEMTTRKPQPGRHVIEALVNGVPFAVGEFDVVL
jgi:3-methyladenine DNA glycosylase AlkC